jgi:S1-C subfamily serine protease
LVLLAAGFGAGWMLGERQHDDDSSGAVPAAAQVDDEDRPTDPPLQETGEEPVADVAAAVAPAVVQLETEVGLGSGVIYDPDGFILTAAHVVEGAETVSVRLADGARVEGRVVGAHPATDIGVVAFEPEADVPVAVLADESPRVGNLAVAIGSPFALDQSVTAGVVSAVDRPVGVTGSVLGVIQTDAPINSGNSGGPLANRSGEVIGINSFIQSESGGNIGLGFAIPVDLAERVADSLVAGTPVEFGYLGVEGADPADGRAGALLTDVTPGSAADEAGLEPGDLVVAIDGEEIASFGELGAIIRSHDPGDEVELTVERDGAEEQITVTLDAAPS